MRIGPSFFKIRSKISAWKRVVSTSKTQTKANALIRGGTGKDVHV